LTLEDITQVVDNIGNGGLELSVVADDVAGTLLKSVYVGMLCLNWMAYNGNADITSQNSAKVVDHVGDGGLDFSVVSDSVDRALSRVSTLVSQKNRL
jgi:hypothetical protein